MPLTESPEKIYRAKIDLTGDWTQWKPTEPIVVAVPEMDYEGEDLPLTVSKEGRRNNVAGNSETPHFLKKMANGICCTLLQPKMELRSGS